MVDLIVVGAGPAGLSAAIYGRRGGLSVLVLEQAIQGGQIINSHEVENYPGFSKISGVDFAMHLYQQAVDLGAQISYEEVTGIRELPEAYLVECGNGSYEAKAVILAVGAKARTLGLIEEAKLVGKGVSYCATCDGAFYRDKTVAVVGGGDVALDDAVYLARLCQKVYLIHRRDSFRGNDRTLKQLQQLEQVEILTDTRILGIMGQEQVSGLLLEQMKEQREYSLPVDGLFVAVGQEPNTACFKNTIKLDEWGYVMAGEDCETRLKGVFVAGDCRTKQLRQLVTAAADGAVAATAAIAYVQKLR